MKCIKSKTTGEIKRVTDEMACKMEAKGWAYVPKSEWKEMVRPQQKTQAKAAEKTLKVFNSEGKPRRSREKKNKR